MEYTLFLSLGISFATTLLILPYWISRAKKAGLAGKDMHKQNSKEIAEMGGITVVFGTVLGILSFIAVRTFIIKSASHTFEILAILSTLLIITLIGMLDDILGWKIGLRQYQKPILTVFAALPIMVVNAGTTVMSIPLLGKIDFGFLYALIIIPVAIVGASNGFNMIAGYNGLEAGLGMLILSTLAYIAYSSGSAWVAIIAACMVLSLLAFYFFNRYPAKVFPGDTMTYTVGAMIAAIAIFANIEKFAAILFTPYFIELLLKLRGRFQKESFAKLSGDGSLILPYTKLYGLEHVAILVLSKIKKRVTENNVVFSLYAFQMLFIIIALVV